jgi:hypothetical protein
MEQNNNIIPNFPFVSIDSRKLIEKYRWVLISIPIILLIAAVGRAAYWYGHRPDQSAARAKAADNRVYSSAQTTTKLLSSNNKFDQAAGLWTTYAASMCQKAESVEGTTFDEADIAASASMSLGSKPYALSRQNYQTEALKLCPSIKPFKNCRHPHEMVAVVSRHRYYYRLHSGA